MISALFTFMLGSPSPSLVGLAQDQIAIEQMIDWYAISAANNKFKAKRGRAARFGT